MRRGFGSLRGRPWWVILVAALVAMDAAAQQSPTRPGGRRGPQLGELEGAMQAVEPTDGRGGANRGGQPVEVTVTTGTASASPSRVVSPQGAFEPGLERPLKYGDAPKADESIKITLTGPMSASEFLDALAVATSWNIASTPKVRETVLEFWTNEITPAQALAILRFNEIYYEYDKEANFLFVLTKEEHVTRAYGSLVQAEFSVNYADLQSIETVLTSLLSAKGRLIADPATSKIIVYDTQDNIDAMRKIMSEIDAPQETRAFQLVHVDAEAMTTSIESLLTESGKLSVDARSNTLVVYDRSQRLDRVAEVLSMLDQELETRSWVLDYADPLTVAEDVGLLVPEAMGSIVVHEDIHQITVTATPYRLNEIDGRIAVWDTKRRQVQIEAYLATMSRNVMRNLNINWSYSANPGGDPLDITVGSLANSDDEDTPAGQGTTIDYQGVPLGVVINMLDTTGDATILAHPRITVQDGQEASFDNTTQVPFASSTTTFDNVGGANSNAQIDFIDVGTRLLVTPRITSVDTILLNIEAEDSTFVSVNVFSNGQLNTLPQKTQNRAQTQVLVHDAETIVLGGLRTSNFSDTVDKVPILGDIPLLGRAFRSTGKDHQDRELLIFMTPTLVGEQTQPEALRLAAVEDSFAQRMRLDDKSYFQRWKHKINNGEEEFAVSVGQTGGIMAEGDDVTMPELLGLIDGVAEPETKTLILREHVRAPKEIASEVADRAMARGMKVQFDELRDPFVPKTAAPVNAGPNP